MNSKIQELKQSAGIEYNPDQEGLNLFAKLVVEECCKVLSKESIIHSGYGYNQHALYQQIQNHFGIDR
jgi:hypothetical protein